MIVDEREFGHSRDWLVELLHRENIGARKYFSPPVHRQKLYSAMWDGRALPVTDLVSDGVVSLPIYSSLTNDSVDKVCEVSDYWRTSIERSPSLIVPYKTSTRRPNHTVQHFRIVLVPLQARLYTSISSIS